MLYRAVVLFLMDHFWRKQPPSKKDESKSKIPKKDKKKVSPAEEHVDANTGPEVIKDRKTTLSKVGDVHRLSSEESESKIPQKGGKTKLAKSRFNFFLCSK